MKEQQSKQTVQEWDEDFGEHRIHHIKSSIGEIDQYIRTDTQKTDKMIEHLFNGHTIMWRFDPDTEEVLEHREFDAAGNIVEIKKSTAEHYKGTVLEAWRRHIAKRAHQNFPDNTDAEQIARVDFEDFLADYMQDPARAKHEWSGKAEHTPLNLDRNIFLKPEPEEHQQ